MFYTLLFTATIGLLSSIQGQLSVGVDDTGNEVKEVDYSNIWNSKSFQDVDYWFLKTGNLTHFTYINLKL
jgi:hypothetical protein